VISAAPFGSVTVSVNVAELPLPLDGDNETGPGVIVAVAVAVAVLVAVGVAVAVLVGVAVAVCVTTGVGVGVAVCVTTGVEVGVAVAVELGTLTAMTRPPRRIYSLEGCGVCASVAVMAIARNARTNRKACGAETFVRNFEISREIFTVPTLSFAFATAFCFCKY
jgi:glycerol kinase